MKNVKKIVCAGVISSLLMLSACSGDSTKTTGNASGGKSTGQKTMFLGMVNPPINFNPVNAPDVASTFVDHFIFEPFLEMPEAQKFDPKLAESFETTDNQTYTIKLNKNAKWSDGQPVTADDVLFTMNLVANPKVETTIGSYIAMLDGLDATGKLPEGVTSIPSVKVVDANTIEFKTKSPVDPNMIKEQLGTKFMTLPKHVLEKINPADLAKDPFFLKPTVTDGPFNFVVYNKDQDVQLAANKDYYLGKPKVDNMYIKIMQAPNIAAQLQTGELDMNVGIGIGKIPPEDFDRVKKLDNVRTKVEPTIGFQTMMFNTTKVKDPKVRQAFAYALNRSKIVDKLLKGYGEVVDGPYTSINPYLDKSTNIVKYDTDTAKQMLKDAGWDFNKTLNLVVPIGNKVREQSADLITQDLQAAGVKVKVSTFDFPTIMQKGKAGDFDLLLMGFTFTFDPDMANLYSKTGSYNFMRYNNPESDKLLAQGKAEADPAKRKEIYSQLQKIWEQDMPIITLYSDSDFDAISKKVTNGEPRISGFHDGIQNWDVSGAK